MLLAVKEIDWIKVLFLNIFSAKITLLYSSINEGITIIGLVSSYWLITTVFSSNS